MYNFGSNFIFLNKKNSFYFKNSKIENGAFLFVTFSDFIDEQNQSFESSHGIIDYFCTFGGIMFGL